MELNNYETNHNYNECTYCNLRHLSKTLNSCLLDGDDIHLGHYLEAYKELKKFCTLLGSVFGFVATEIESKSNILENFRKEDQCGNFVTLKKMIDYEKEKGLLNNKNYISGSRTLLVLNRGLDFLKTFLARTSELELTDSTYSVGKHSYRDTLAHYHVWYVRAAAEVAMLGLPSKQNLLNYVLGDTINVNLQFLPEVIKAADKVYNTTYNNFRNYNLLSLA